ncbi:MAG: hypothetical protein ABIG56_01215 [Candidatus Omnitrophota bacterium]
MPKEHKFFAGYESHAIFKRYLKNEMGKIRSTQHFLLVSYGLSDWFSIDLKVGAGNIKQNPPASDEVDYRTNFAGGYGLRVKFYEKERAKAVFGFQHISVHPRSTHLGNNKHQAVLDDWQVSLLASYDFSKLTSYLGTRWSRVDYIHWNIGNRNRVMSDMTKEIGLIFGIDLPIAKKVRLNLEGQVLDSEALSFSVIYDF